MQRSNLFVFVLVATLVGNVWCSIFGGFQIGREFSYLGKFCFTWDPDFNQTIGEIRARVRTPDDGVKLAIYDDEAEFWKFITTDPNCDCECKLSEAHTKAVFDVPRATDAAHTFELNYTIREHLRPRFWYVALAKCVPDGDAFHPTLKDLTPSNFQHYYFTAWYHLHMVQAIDQSEVPVYQQHLDMVYLVMAVLTGCLLFLQLQSASTSRVQSESFHPIIQLLSSLVALAFISNVSLTLHFFAYEGNGFGAPLLLCLARIFQAIVRVGMLLLAMLIAKGWTINSITLHGRASLTIVVLAYFVLYLSLAMWYLGFVDPSSTLYLYDSLPGLGICSLQGIVLYWFLHHLNATAAKEESLIKRRFFFQMAALFTIYILSLPVMVCIASFLSPWVREKIVESVTVSIEFITMSILVYLLWPSRAPHYFDRLYSLVGSQSEKANLCDASLPSNQL